MGEFLLFLNRIRTVRTEDKIHVTKLAVRRTDPEETIQQPNPQGLQLVTTQMSAASRKQPLTSLQCHTRSNCQPQRIAVLSTTFQKMPGVHFGCPDHCELQSRLCRFVGFASVVTFSNAIEIVDLHLAVFQRRSTD